MHSNRVYKVVSRSSSGRIADKASMDPGFLARSGLAVGIQGLIPYFTADHVELWAGEAQVSTAAEPQQAVSKRGLGGFEDSKPVLC